MTTYRVDGMTCGGCEKSLTRLLERAALQVEAISFSDCTVTIRGEHDAAVVAQVVEAAGFDFAGPARPSGA